MVPSSRRACRNAGVARRSCIFDGSSVNHWIQIRATHGSIPMSYAPRSHPIQSFYPLLHVLSSARIHSKYSSFSVRDPADEGGTSFSAVHAAHTAANAARFRHIPVCAHGPAKSQF